MDLQTVATAIGLALIPLKAGQWVVNKIQAHDLLLGLIEPRFDRLERKIDELTHVVLTEFKGDVDARLAEGNSPHVGGENQPNPSSDGSVGVSHEGSSGASPSK